MLEELIKISKEQTSDALLNTNRPNQYSTEKGKSENISSRTISTADSF